MRLDPSLAEPALVMSARSSPLCEAPSFQARLIHYPPGLRQADHEHARAQISFLLVGDAREVVGRREAEVSVTASGIKPAGIRHAAEFGRNGALMLAFDFGAGAEPEGVNWSEPCRWRPLTSQGKRLIASALNDSGTNRADLLWDVLAAPAESDPHRSPILSWLLQARERIADAPDEAQIGGIAAELGIHRVHFSRRFQEAFGLAPSVYRARCMAARSASRIVDGEDFAQAALGSGFADQSHMTRTLKRHTGLAPSMLRAMFT